MMSGTGAAKSNANPAFAYQTDSRQSYQLTLTNQRSKGTSLVFVMALDVVSNNASNNVRGGITVQLNGQPMQFASGGAIEVNGRVMVPLRELFEAMNARVGFNAYDNSYTVEQGNNFIQLRIGSPLVVINGTTYQMDAAPIVHNGIAMAPLRFFAQAAGAKIDWNGQRRLISITAEN
jgi:hypothetical protein